MQISATTIFNGSLQKLRSTLFNHPLYLPYFTAISIHPRPRVIFQRRRHVTQYTCFIGHVASNKKLHTPTLPSHAARFQNRRFNRKRTTCMLRRIGRLLSGYLQVRAENPPIVIHPPLGTSATPRELNDIEKNFAPAAPSTGSVRWLRFQRDAIPIPGGSLNPYFPCL